MYGGGAEIDFARQRIAVGNKLESRTDIRDGGPQAVIGVQRMGSQTIQETHVGGEGPGGIVGQFFAQDRAGHTHREPFVQECGEAA